MRYWYKSYSRFVQLALELILTLCVFLYTMAKVTHHAMFHPNAELVSQEAHQVHELEYPADHRLLALASIMPNPLHTPLSQRPCGPHPPYYSHAPAKTYST